MSRTFVVTAIEGHTEVSSFSDPGPCFVEVMVSAANNLGETIRFRRPLDDQPHVGDAFTFGEELPESAVYPRSTP